VVSRAILVEILSGRLVLVLPKLEAFALERYSKDNLKLSTDMTDSLSSSDLLCKPLFEAAAQTIVGAISG